MALRESVHKTLKQTDEMVNLRRNSSGRRAHGARQRWAVIFNMCDTGVRCGERRMADSARVPELKK